MDDTAAKVLLKRPSDQLPRGEILAVILQYLLYHRRQVPVLVSALLRNQDSSRDDHADAANVPWRLERRGMRIDRFRSSFSAVRNDLESLFRAAYGLKLKRAAIIIGSGPSTPADVYLIEFPTMVMEELEARGDADFVSLTDGECRRIGRQLIDQGVCYRRGDREFNEIDRAMKVFFLIEAKFDCVPAGFLPRPDLDLLQYSTVADESKTKRMRAVNWIVLRIMGLDGVDAVSGGSSTVETEKAIGEASSSEVQRYEEKEIIWFQLENAVVGFDE